MTKRASKAQPAPAPLREPHRRERISIDRSKEKIERMSADRIEAPRIRHNASADGDVVLVTNPHTDRHGWNEHVMASLGTLSPVFGDRLCAELANAKGADAKDYTDALEHGLAFVAGIAPENELEATLAAQMFAVHVATMECARRAATAKLVPQLEANGGMMVKLARTFTAQVEALAKLRTGGKQQVEVRYVYVDARGSQNVIAAGGLGGERGSGGQPPAPAQLSHDPAADGPPLWSQDPFGLAVHGASDPREAALPDARRPEPGRAERAGERGLGGRSVQPGGGGEPEGDAGAAEVEPGDAA